MTIGENIRKLRRERDITQESLAEMLGVSAQAVRGMETCGVWRHDTHNRTHDLIERLSMDDYAFLRDDDEMKTVLEKLAEFAE